MTLVPWLTYRVFRGQVYEGVSQISMGWMLSSLGTAIETYGQVARVTAINRGSGVAAHSSRQGAEIQLSGIRRSADIERGSIN
jgi:hypothetical protein